MSSSHMCKHPKSFERLVADSVIGAIRYRVVDINLLEQFQYIRMNPYGYRYRGYLGPTIQINYPRPLYAIVSNVNVVGCNCI